MARRDSLGETSLPPNPVAMATMTSLPAVIPIVDLMKSTKAARVSVPDDIEEIVTE